MSKKSEILVLGTIAFDEIITPTAVSGKILGGSASYISMSIFLKKPKSIISIVGNDFPEKNLKMFEAKDIDISGVQVHKKEKTFYWKGLYGENVNERETLQTNVNALLGFTPNLKEKHMSPKIIVLGNISPTAQLTLLNKLRATTKPFVILDTMNYWIDNNLKEVNNVIEKADLIVINNEEAEQLTSTNDLDQAAETLIKKGPRYVIIKKGDQGATAYSRKKVFSIKALKQEKVVDTTGAGDSFAGGLAGYLSNVQEIRFDSIKEALYFATAAASICIESFGTKALQSATKEEFFSRVDKIKKIQAFNQ